jgi:hypothetical protein
MLERNASTRIFQISVTSELIHILRHDLAGCPNILGQKLVCERVHFNGSVSGRIAKSPGKPDQCAREASLDAVHGKTLNPVSELH